jgi:Leucine-rich repeat (LRR) protein
LDNNEFTGTIPASVAELRKLFFFGAGGNRLVGEISEFMCDLVQLRQFYLYSNMLTGTVPGCIGRLSEMLFLYLQENQLHGTIPATVANMSRLGTLYLYNNNLSGSLPEALGNLTSLQYMYLQVNALTGTIPLCIGKLPHLLAVLLFENQLEGSLEGVFDPVLQTELTTLQISDNQLTGTLPDAIFQLPALSTFVAVSNCFHGELKESMCSATNLIALALDGLQSASDCRRELLPGISSSYLSDNSLKSRIPECLFSMPLLNTLHLSGANHVCEDAIAVLQLLNITLMKMTFHYELVHFRYMVSFLRGFLIN